MATVTPANATNETVAWTTSNAAVATVSGGKSPYSATVFPKGIAIAVFNGSTLTVMGIKAGSATATVKGSDGGNVWLPITVTVPDAFKAAATSRWETDGEETIRGDNASYTFIADGGTLFSSMHNKWGHASLDGSRFRLIEWSAAALVRTEAGAEPVFSFTIEKEEAGVVWMKFTFGDAEHRVVDEKWIAEE
jgi:hypothetical protein